MGYAAISSMIAWNTEVICLSVLVSPYPKALQPFNTSCREFTENDESVPAQSQKIKTDFFAWQIPARLFFMANRNKEGKHRGITLE